MLCAKMIKRDLEQMSHHSQVNLYFSLSATSKYLICLLSSYFAWKADLVSVCHKGIFSSYLSYELICL